MTRQIVIDHPGLGAWVGAQSGTRFMQGADHSFGVIEDSILAGESGYYLGGIIATNYSHAAIWFHMSGTSNNWMSPTFLWLVFHYAFVQLGVKRVYALVEVANERALKIDLRAGFQIAATLPDVFASGSAVVLYMEPAMCKWLNVKPRNFQANWGDSYGQEARRGTGT